jgi:hypothetical protein
MSFFYSKTTNSFYNTNIHVTMPPDAIAITDTVYNEMISSQASGNSWVSDQNGNPLIVTRPVVTLTLAQITLQQMMIGLNFVSTSTPALNGLYPTDDLTQTHLQAEVVSILLNSTFADGTNSIIWLDTSNNPHTFNVDQFKLLASAIGTFVSLSIKTANGLYNTLPSNTITVA